MAFNNLNQFFQELAVLAAAGFVTALLCSIVVKDRWLALFVAAGLSTLILNVWKYLSIGTLDIPFLVQAFVISSAMAIPVISIADSVRGRRAQAV
jgi:hypothetical protein